MFVDCNTPSTMKLKCTATRLEFIPSSNSYNISDIMIFRHFLCYTSSVPNFKKMLLEKFNRFHPRLFTQPRNVIINKTGTCQVGAIPKVLMKNVQDVMKYSQKVPKHRKGASRARKMLQKFGYSVREQMGSLVFDPLPPPCKRNIARIQLRKFCCSALLLILRQEFGKYYEKIIDIL